jgi:hypothetical protein
LKVGAWAVMKNAATTSKMPAITQSHARTIDTGSRVIPIGRNPSYLMLPVRVDVSGEEICSLSRTAVNH